MNKSVMTRFLVFFSLLVLPVFVFAGGGQSAGETKPASGSKTLSAYFAWGDDELPYYVAAFERDTGITINYVRLSAGEMIARTIAEKANPRVSLLIGGGTENFITAANEGLLEPYNSPELADIPKEYYDPQGFWVPVGVVTLDFAVNTEWFEKQKLPYPQTWDDLTNPVYKGMIAMAHPTTSGVSSNILTSIIQWKGEEEGWKYFQALNQNIPHYVKASSSTPSAVALGEAAIGLTNESDTVKFQLQGYPIKAVIPNPTFLDVNAAAIVKGGPASERENARIFIDWLLSTKGQESFIEANSYRVPLNAKAKASEGLTPVSKITVKQIDRAKSGAQRTALIKEFGERIDNASNLK
jgi:iron(III) transport system substrate-binding protein